MNGNNNNIPALAHGPCVVCEATGHDGDAFRSACGGCQRILCSDHWPQTGVGETVDPDDVWTNAFYDNHGTSPCQWCMNAKRRAFLASEAQEGEAWIGAVVQDINAAAAEQPPAAWHHHPEDWVELALEEGIAFLSGLYGVDPAPGLGNPAWVPDGANEFPAHWLVRTAFWRPAPAPQPAAALEAQVAALEAHADALEAQLAAAEAQLAALAAQANPAQMAAAMAIAAADPLAAELLAQAVQPPPAEPPQEPHNDEDDPIH